MPNDEQRPVAIAITHLVRRLGVDAAREQANALRQQGLGAAADAIEQAITWETEYAE